MDYVDPLLATSAGNVLEFMLIQEAAKIRGEKRPDREFGGLPQIPSRSHLWERSKLRAHWQTATT